MSGEERSPKRQRLGSYSPASPPIIAESYKQSDTSHPQTPPPSVRMSPSWSQQGQMLPGLGYQGPSPPNTATSQSFHSQSQSNGGSSGAVESEQQTQTPATTVGDADVRDSSGNEGGDTQMTDADNRRTDHERKDEGGSGVLSKLSTELVPSSAPTADVDLLAMYSLKNLQQSVARRDPVTGEKINALRKSYTNKVRDLGLEGKNKATKSQNELWGLVDPVWDNKLEDGSTMWQQQRGELMMSEDDVDGIMGMLDSALGGMREGHLPKKDHEEWKATLGLDEATTAVTGTAKPLPHPPSQVPLGPGSKIGPPNPNFMPKTAAGAAIRNSAPASPRNANGAGVAARPDRAGKKRRYDESSYEGYDDDGYDTGGADDRRGSGGGKRQKRKDNFPSTSPPFSNPTTSTVGVRSS